MCWLPLFLLGGLITSVCAWWIFKDKYSKLYSGQLKRLETEKVNIQRELTETSEKLKSQDAKNTDLVNENSEYLEKIAKIESKLSEYEDGDDKQNKISLHSVSEVSQTDTNKDDIKNFDAEKDMQSRVKVDDFNSLSDTDDIDVDDIQAAIDLNSVDSKIKEDIQETASVDEHLDVNDLDENNSKLESAVESNKAILDEKTSNKVALDETAEKQNTIEDNKVDVVKTNPVVNLEEKTKGSSFLANVIGASAVGATSAGIVSKMSKSDIDDDLAKNKDKANEKNSLKLTDTTSEIKKDSQLNSLNTISSYDDKSKTVTTPYYNQYQKLKSNKDFVDIDGKDITDNDLMNKSSVENMSDKDNVEELVTDTVDSSEVKNLDKPDTDIENSSNTTVSQPQTTEFDKQAARKAIGKTVKLDDLKLVEGIGPKICNLFHEAGIKTWHQLSVTSIEVCKQILTDAGSRYKMHDPTTWPEQSKLAAEGKWEELAKLQDQLKGGRRS